MKGKISEETWERGFMAKDNVIRGRNQDTRTGKVEEGTEAHRNIVKRK